MKKLLMIMSFAALFQCVHAADKGSLERTLRATPKTPETPNAPLQSDPERRVSSEKVEAALKVLEDAIKVDLTLPSDDEDDSDKEDIGEFTKVLCQQGGSIGQRSMRVGFMKQLGLPPQHKDTPEDLQSSIGSSEGDSVYGDCL